MIITASRKLKSSYSPGPDGVPAVIFRRCIASLAVPLSRIFNTSFEQKTFPDMWKQSFMFPVFKKGDKRNVKNYRGITSLSAGSKLFEIIVSSVILNYSKSYISVNQHGFMPGRSVTSNLLDFTSACISQIETKAQVDAVYTDLKAAFDVIDHRILLCKLSRIGISDRLLSWLESYLSNRILRVKLDSAVSRAFSNSSGVPQGSNLGPLLFALFFNDVALLLGSEYVLIYADDLKIYLTVKSVEDCRRLQGLINTFADWCRLNKLLISVSKCMVITFHRSKNPIIFDYRIEGNVLERVDQISDLGIILDAKLSFNQHISSMISKASRQLGFVTKVSREFTDPHCLKTLYCALVRPILENASIIWTPYHLSWNIRIERIQRRFIRIALRSLPWRDPQNLPPYNERCRLLGLDSLQRRRSIQQSIFVAKLLNGEIDAPALLTRVNFRTMGRQLRSSTMLTTRFHRTSYGCNEPLTACLRTFSLVEELFDFGETTGCFKRRVTSSRILQ